MFVTVRLYCMPCMAYYLFFLIIFLTYALLFFCSHRSKCGCTDWNASMLWPTYRMLAFESVRLQMLRWPDRFPHVQLSRFASQHHAIFLPRRIKHACSVKHLEFRNVPCAVLKFRFERSNRTYNPRLYTGSCCQDTCLRT